MARENRVDWRPLGYGSGLVLVLAILVLVNKRQLGDVVLLVLIGLVVMAVFGFYLVAPALRRKRARDEEAEAQARAEAERDAPWEFYSHMDGADYVIGVQRRAQGFREAFSQREMYRFSDIVNNPPEISRTLDAEGDALSQVYRLNAAMKGAI